MTSIDIDEMPKQQDEEALSKALRNYGGDPRFLMMLEEIAKLHAAKQEDYGLGTDPFANVRASQEFGVAPWLGALIRLNDKVTRLKSFAQKGFMKNESVEDSLMDMAVYSIIAYILFREEQEVM